MIFFASDNSIYRKLINMSDKKQRLFEVMGKVNPDFKNKLNEDAPFSTEHLIMSAIRTGLISQEEYNGNRQLFDQAAEETVDSFSDWSEGEGFGSSDMTAAKKEFLDNAGIKNDYINNRLTRLDQQQSGITEIAAPVAPAGAANAAAPANTQQQQQQQQNVTQQPQYADTTYKTIAPILKLVNTPEKFAPAFKSWFSYLGYNPQTSQISISQIRIDVENILRQLGYK